MLGKLESISAPRTLVVYQRDSTGSDRRALEEIRLLARSAGAEVVASRTAYRQRPHPATFLGPGKVEELRGEVDEAGIELVILNHSISPAQERNLERALRCRVLDRTGLILDIFAQRAVSHEGKLQVELAQLTHLSTRLVRGWTHLERQKGGIGLRGPGETQLETDRRLIGHRMKALRERLERVSVQRGLQRKSRARVPVPTVSLVGYTNAGKSSLFNRLTSAQAFVEDQLFATLDTTMRRFIVPDFGEAILSDTVGFIRDLPHTLVQAFHSTLEEVTGAQLLVHVVDAASEQRDECIHEVTRVLREIGAEQVPVITAYNKIDLTGQPPVSLRNPDGYADRVWLSAYTGEGVPELLVAIQGFLGAGRRACRVHLPVTAARLRAKLYQLATVHGEQPVNDGGWSLDLELSSADFGWLSKQGEVLRIEPLA